MNDSAGGSKFLSTGCESLDRILAGGYIAGNAYLIRGGPGTGKTTLGLHYLQEGIDQGEEVLFISLGEDADKLKQNGRQFGFDVDAMRFLDLTPEPEFFAEGQTSSIFEDADVDLNPLIDQIRETIDQFEPRRIFVDSISQFRFLIPSDYQFHKYALSFNKYLLRRAESVVMVSEPTPTYPDEDLQFLSDGVIHLESYPNFRQLTISKFRGADFQGGHHAYAITPGGIRVYPNLKPDGRNEAISYAKLSFGVDELDDLMHGGIERGCATLITGPSGVGKTTLGMQFMKEASRRGERSVIYLFDEKKEVLISRCESIGIPIKDMLDEAKLEINELSPQRYTIQQFHNEVKRQVEEEQTRIIMIDSIRGLHLLSNMEDMSHALHPLNTYLKNNGVTLLLINEVEYLTGDFRITDVGISYMSDIVIFLRFIEYMGDIQKAIGILKNRLSDYETTLRRYQITKDGIKVGEPMDNMRGILTGSPSFVDS